MLSPVLIYRVHIMIRVRGYTSTDMIIIEFDK